jgi:hypothetical protein
MIGLISGPGPGENGRLLKDGRGPVEGGLVDALEAPAGATEEKLGLTMSPLCGC